MVSGRSFVLHRRSACSRTGVILVVVVLMSLMLGLIDFILGGGVKLLLGS